MENSALLPWMWMCGVWYDSLASLGSSSSPQPRRTLGPGIVSFSQVIHGSRANTVAGGRTAAGQPVQVGEALFEGGGLEEPDVLAGLEPKRDGFLG